MSTHKDQGFPYRPKPKQTKAKSSVPLGDKGTEKHHQGATWLTDGPLRQIEKGLPIIASIPANLDPFKNPPMERFVSLLVDRPYVKDFRKMYGSLADKYPELDIKDNENLTAYEKQFIADNSAEVAEQLEKASSLKVRVMDENGKFTNKLTTNVPTNAHLYTWGGTISYFESQIFEDEPKIAVDTGSKKQKKKTGIYGKPDTSNPDATGLIRDIHFSSIPDKEVDSNFTLDDNTQKPLNLGTIIHPLADKTEKLPTFSPMVTKCIDQFFDPHGKPFVPKDVEKYFPLEELKITQRVTDSSSTKPEIMINLETDPLTECDPKTTLIDTSDQDIIFTKSKAPFRRREIAALRAFNSHWENQRKFQTTKFKHELMQRDRMVHKAFQSRSIFNKYLELLDKDCKRIRYGLIGKSPFKRKSIWQVAIEEADYDPSSLGVRREFWYKFCKFVQVVGGIREEYDMKVAHELRRNLMDNHPVDKTLFFDTVSKMPNEALLCVGSLKLLEFLRVALDIESDEFIKILDTRKISNLIYTQTILSNMSPEHSSAMKTIPKEKIDIPDIDELITPAIPSLRGSVG